MKIDNIFKKIKKKQIIQGVTLSVNEGEIFGLVGANGAGKTTIIRMMTGLIKPTQGCVYINGKNVYQNVNALSDIGAIIEGPDLYRHLSGYRNLKIAANMYDGVSEERIKEVASLLGIQTRLGDKVKTYSLGMRQRLAIAITLLNQPKLLVLDEPLNGLDPQGVREIRTLMKELSQKEKVTIIISSHILSELELVCDRFCILNQGMVSEVKDMEISRQSEGECEIAFLAECNMVETEKLIKGFDIDIVSMESGKVVIKTDERKRADLIKKLSECDYQIKTVIPLKVSLEDYFIQKVGENK